MSGMSISTEQECTDGIPLAPGSWPRVCNHRHEMRSLLMDDGWVAGSEADPGWLSAGSAKQVWAWKMGSKGLELLQRDGGHAWILMRRPPDQDGAWCV